MKRSFALGIVLATSLAHAATLTRGPYLQLRTTTSMTVVWNTDVAARCTLTLRPLDGEAKQVTGGTSTLCTIALQDLSPGTRYGYVARADGEPLIGEAVFQTDHPDRPFTFLVFGDSGDGDNRQLAVRDAMLKTPADWLLHTGDMVYDRGAAEDFDPKFFAPYADLLRTHVLWPCLGNHDVKTADGAPWRAAFLTPANNPAHSENYYSFRAGNALIVVLDSNQDLSPGGAQAVFAEHELATSSALWKFVVFHHTLYSSGVKHGSDEKLRGLLAPLFDGQRVDIVFMGHEHNYERTHPLRNNVVVPPAEGTTYVTTGGGGKNLYAVNGASFTAYAESAPHFVRVAIDARTLKLDMIRTDGAIRDSFTLTKPTTPAPDRLVSPTREN